MARGRKADVNKDSFIQKRLNEIGMSQKELANKLNVTPPMVNQWISGYRNIPEVYKEKLEEILGCPFNLLQGNYIGLEQKRIIFLPVTCETLEDIILRKLTKAEKDFLNDIFSKSYLSMGSYNSLADKNKMNLKIQTEVPISVMDKYEIERINNPDITITKFLGNLRRKNNVTNSDAQRRQIMDNNLNLQQNNESGKIKEDIKVNDNLAENTTSEDCTDIDEMMEFASKCLALKDKQSTILSKDIKLPLNCNESKINNNIITIGGSGSGKSRCIIEPNILQCNTNFIVKDLEGRLLKTYGPYLKENGYDIKILNFKDTENSFKYNPFKYLREETDVIAFADILLKTSEDEINSNDSYWIKAEASLLKSVVLYMWHTSPIEEHSFERIVKFITEANVNENDNLELSSFNKKILELESNDPGNSAVKFYKSFNRASKNTRKSIILSLLSRLNPYLHNGFSTIIKEDDFDFDTFADSKQCIFIIASTPNITANSLINIMYYQLFNTLYSRVESNIECECKVVNSNKDVIKVFRPENRYMEYDDVVQSAYLLAVKINNGVKIEYDELTASYGIKTLDGELLCLKESKEEAEEYAETLKSCEIIKNDKNCHYHVRFIVDSENISWLSKISDKLNLIRKYNMSFLIMIDIIQQLTTNCGKEWNIILSSCDTEVLLGTSDYDTLKYFELKSGIKATASRDKKNDFNVTHLISADNLMNLDKKKCLIKMRGSKLYVGEKYDLTEHPDYNKIAADISDNK